jgi:hypothetical protein
MTKGNVLGDEPADADLDVVGVRTDCQHVDWRQSCCHAIAL